MRAEGCVKQDMHTPMVEVTNFAAPVTPSSEDEVLIGILFLSLVLVFGFRICADLCRVG